jgi:1-acyl-sn-glycerol-3-phosphate acyltransferase
MTKSTSADFLRSTIYHCLIWFITILMGLAFLPLLLLKSNALKYFVPHLWSKIALLLQKYILRLNYEVIGADNISPNGGAIYAVKHQSAWETLALWHILDKPVFVLKKELLNIPIFGWYLAKVDNIVIDRKAGKKAILQIIAQSEKYLIEGRNIVIFPEGTRTKVGAESKYKAGIGALYSKLNTNIIPVALNSGIFWGRNAWVRKSGLVQVQFLKAMPEGLSNYNFMQTLQNEIETASNELIKNHI